MGLTAISTQSGSPGRLHFPGRWGGLFHPSGGYRLRWVQNTYGALDLPWVGRLQEVQVPRRCCPSPLH